MKCCDIQILLPDNVWGKTSSDEKSLVEEHLRGCPSCREDADQLMWLMTKLQHLNQPSPSRAYWGTLLPRIHARIEHKSSSVVPEWAIRFAFPATAALVLVMFILNGRILTTGVEERELSALLLQLSSDEIQQVADQTTLSEGITPLSATDDQSQLSDSDKEVLEQLIQTEVSQSIYAELNVDEAVSSLSDQEEEQLVSVLQQRLIN